MPASKPHVVFQQVLKNDCAKVKANFQIASPEQLKQYAEYTHKPGHSHYEMSMLDAAVGLASPKIVALLLENGVRPSGSRSVWDEWQKRAAPQNFKDVPMPSPEQAMEAWDVLDVLIKYKVSALDAIGKHYGPAHKVISVYRKNPERALQALKNLYAGGFGVDDRDEIGETPLALATWVSNIQVVQWLIDKGANLSNRTTGDKSLLQFVFRDFTGPREIKKSTQPDQVNQLLRVLRDAGYDLEAEMQDKEKLSKHWIDKRAFEDDWRFLSSFVQGEQLQETTFLAGSHRKSPRL